MKKFKLIKKYPGSFELRDIVTKAHTYYVSDQYEDALPHCDVENQPEFWEEIIEKDYEI